MRKHLTLLSILAVITLFFGTAYAMVQFALRQDANDPQIQLAEDGAASLDKGASPYSLTNLGVDMAHSLTPFVIVYDRQGHVVAGSGYLDGKVPVVPMGVLEHSIGHSYHAITWQPAANVRIASITVSSKNYFVLSGRSLTEVEKRETDTEQMAGLAWLLSIGIVFGNVWLRSRVLK